MQYHIAKRDPSGGYMIIQQETFGVTREGKPVEAYRLENKAGEYLRIITFGGAMQAI